MLAFFINEIILAYIIATSIFLILCLCFKSIRKKSNAFLNYANLIVLITLFINIALIINQTIACKAEQLEQLHTLNSTKIAFLNLSNCYPPLFITTIFGFGFQLVFLFKKNRIKISTTIVSILLLTILENIERIIGVVTSIFRDFLPSSWSTYYDTTNKLWTLLFSFIFFAICWITPDYFTQKKGS